MALTEELAEAYHLSLASQYASMKFYAIFPNGTKVPLAEVVPNMIANPELRPMKTIGDLGVQSRLVLVVEMTNPNPDGSETLYARQAFYLSTGTSSDMPDTWLPFDGIVLGLPQSSGLGKELIPPTDPYWDPPPPDGSYEVFHQVWFDKYQFLTDSINNYEDRKKDGHETVRELFQGNFLPEPAADRHGPYSHVLASYILGGGRWARAGPGAMFVVMPGAFYRRQWDKYPGSRDLDAATLAPRPVNPVFVELRNSLELLPRSSAMEINNYISTFDAVSYLNGFINTGIPVPKPLAVSIATSQGDTPFELPLFFFVNNIRRLAHKVFIKVRTGEIGSAPETISAALQESLVRDLGTVRGARGKWDLREHLGRIAFRIKPDQANVEGGVRRRRTQRFKMPRKYSKKYCKKTPCKRMGFTQRSSCRPYKNCF